MAVFVPVPVMRVRVMGMAVDQPGMAMAVAVRLVLGRAGRVIMLVMRIVNMAMFMLDFLMRVFMLVALRQMQP